MAVYKQTYRGYEGPTTPEWSRALILYRYALRAVFRSKLLLGFYLICFVFPLVDLIAIYVANHASFLAGLGIRNFFAINRSFFYSFVHYQCVFAFLYTAFAAPGLVAPDLAHGGLALYLARPLRRFEYLLGKILVLVVLLSGLTWVPGLFLFAVQCVMGSAAWRSANAWLGWSIFAASWIWIIGLSLLALAVSAWIKWRVVAGAALLGIYFFGAGLGGAMDLVLNTQNGGLLDFMQLHLLVWSDLFRLAPPPLALEREAWAVLIVLALGSLALVLRRVRPLEVVR